MWYSRICQQFNKRFLHHTRVLVGTNDKPIDKLRYLSSDKSFLRYIFKRYLAYRLRDTSDNFNALCDPFRNRLYRRVDDPPFPLFLKAWVLRTQDGETHHLENIV